MLLCRNTLIFTLPLTLLFLPSCKKSDGPNSSSNHNIFVVGSGPGSLSSSMAILWKNGSPTMLGQDSQYYVSAGNGLFVQDTDIYVCGAATDEWGLSAACYWKNGVFYQPNLGRFMQSYSTSIFVSGPDIYLAGSGPYLASSAAAVWKNDSMSIISNSGTSVANGVFISGSDVYIAGDESQGGQSTVAVYWKNNTKTVLSTKYPYNSSHAGAITISGGDLYIAGNEADNYQSTVGEYATYWKNDVPNHIGILDSNRITSIFVSGQDVYLAGTKQHPNGDFCACYWKNGVVQFLTDQPFSQANAIYVLDGDVYTAGFIGRAAAYWKNNTTFYLKGITANGIYVK